MQTVPSDHVFEIPTDVAVCPYCGDKLVAKCEAWSQTDDGSWDASELAIDCLSEPDIDGDKWDDWWSEHSQMPYVYWMPMTIKVIEWVNKHFRFDMDDSVSTSRERGEE